MPRTSVAATFAKAMDRLMTQRKKHLGVIAKTTTKLAEIDALFAKFGVTVDQAKAGKGGREPAKARVKTKAKTSVKTRAAGAAGGQANRKQYAQSAKEMILALLKAGPRTTAQINAAWRQAGRRGVANVDLTDLFQAGKIKRQKMQGAKGSTYSLA